MIPDLRFCKCNIQIAARNKREKGHILAIFMTFCSRLRTDVSHIARSGEAV
jgi:hypothetical protein